MLIIIIITIKILCDKQSKEITIFNRKKSTFKQNIPTKPRAERWNLKVYRKGPWGQKRLDD